MIVGISGKAGSGKSTVAAHLVERIDGAVQVNFADEIRQLLIRMYGALPHQVYGGHEGRNYVLPCGKTVRRVAQEAGDALRRIWTDAVVYSWQQRLVEAYAEYGMVPVIVADLRCVNEAEAIRNRGGIIIRLTRNQEPAAERRWIRDLLRWPGAPRASRSQMERAARAHMTETALDGYDFDAVIDNAAMTIDEANAEAMRICRHEGIL